MVHLHGGNIFEAFFPTTVAKQIQVMQVLSDSQPAKPLAWRQLKTTNEYIVHLHSNNAPKEPEKKR